MARLPATILLLSSAPVVRAVIAEVLDQAGHVVLATGDLGRAVDILAETPIDLLITHPYVESIPGHQAARYLRERNPRMAILIVAGLPADDRIEIRAELENFEIFPAPFPVAQLVEKVEAILKQRESSSDSAQRA
jgi:DNA-binding response OmpR family regulator